MQLKQLCLGLGLLATSAVMAAPTAMSDWYIGAGANVNVAMGHQNDYTQQSTNLVITNPIGYTLLVGRHVRKNWDLQFTFVQLSKFKTEVMDNMTHDISWRAKHLMNISSMTAKYHFDLFPHVQFYLAAGAGYAFDYIQYTDAKGNVEDTETAPNMSGVYGAGFDFNFGRFGAQLSYLSMMDDRILPQQAPAYMTWNVTYNF